MGWSQIRTTGLPTARCLHSDAAWPTHNGMTRSGSTGNRRRPLRWALCDLGATNARFAVLAPGTDAPGSPVVLRCDGHDGPDALLAAGLAALPVAVDALAMAAAGPVSGTASARARVTITNRPWKLAAEKVVRRHRLARCLIVNDFAAVAMGLDALGRHDFSLLWRGRAEPKAPGLVLGPGTGLGVAALVPDPSDGPPIVVACEGGHALAAPPPGLPPALRKLWQHRSPCWEDLVSGPGLLRLYRALATRTGRAPTPEAIPVRAAEGDPAARSALGAFARLLGACAGDFALIHGARGGVYVAGGILPGLGDRFDRRAFAAGFLGKGRFRDYLAAIPVRLVTHPAPALPGLARLVRRP